MTTGSILAFTPPDADPTHTNPGSAKVIDPCGRVTAADQAGSTTDAEVLALGDGFMRDGAWWTSPIGVLYAPLVPVG